MADDGSDTGGERSDRGDWGPRLDDLAKRRERARAMGGPERLARRRDAGQLDARARVERLLDPGSFVELGALAGDSSTPADALVAGSGRIDRRPVLVGAEDFTVKGGSIGPAAADKRYRLTQLAASERVPLVMLLEGAGHRMTNTLERTGRGPNDLQGLAELAGRVPTVCAVMGPSAGHGALTAPLCDFVVMREGGSLFSAGPPLVKAAIGEDVDAETLGGTAVHVDASGVAHNAAPDDGAVLDLVRRYLAYFPANAWQRPARRAGPDAGPRSLDALLDLVPADSRRPYRMRDVVELLVDAGSSLEIQPRYGRAMITCLARIGGHAVALIANEPAVRAGAIDTAAASKGARFLEVVGAFHLPVVFLADNPGVQAGSRAEREGALRAAARLFAAQHRLSGAKLHVTLRKAFGFGSSVMAMNPFDGQTLSLAFPGATLGAMPSGAGGAAAKVDDATQAALEAAELEASYHAASGLAYDDVIDPRELRNRLIEGLDLAAGRATEAPSPVPRWGALP